VLDDVERRRFLVEPAREDAVPAAVGLLDVELDEGAGQLLLFPGRGGLAGAQSDDDVLPAHRLTGPESHILHDAVALVEDAQDGHALRHRSHAALPRRGCRNLSAGGGGDVLLRLLFAAPAGSERQRHQQRCSEPPHAYSGIQGS
jgi:hypothetical protein